MGLDRDGENNAVHIHRGKLFNLSGPVAATEVAALGGMVSVCINKQESVDNSIAVINLKHDDLDVEKVEGQWVFGASHLREEIAGRAFYKDGKEAGRVVGFNQKPVLKEKLQAQL